MSEHDWRSHSSHPHHHDGEAIVWDFNKPPATPAASADVDADRTWPCIWCGAPLIDCGYESPCCDLNDHPFATAREAIATIRAEADERVATLREASDNATPGPWIRKWASLDVHAMTGDGVLNDPSNIDFAVACVNYVRAALDAAPDEDNF